MAIFLQIKFENLHKAVSIKYLRIRSMKLLRWTRVDVRTVSESNTFEHWRARSRRHSEQKFVVKKSFESWKKENLSFPVHVHVTRIAPRKLDEHDNLRSSLKYIVDAISEILIPGKSVGRADDSGEIIWHYDQKKGAVREYAVDIKIFKEDVDANNFEEKKIVEY